MTSKEVDAMIAEADDDGDRKLNYNEVTTKGTIIIIIIYIRQWNQGFLKSSQGTVARKPEETCMKRWWEGDTVLEVGGKPQR